MRLVLLPGMDGTGLMFEPLLAILPPRFQPEVVTYPADEPLGYDALAERVAANLPTEPFLLLGESFSGPVAIQLAARRPTGLRALILTASFARSPVRWFPPALTPLVGGWAFAVSPSALRTRLLLGAHATPPLRALLDRALAIPTPATMAARARALLRVDVTEALRACPAPITYLQADQDRVVPASAWQAIARARPDAARIVLSGPHLLLQVDPAGALAALERL